MEKIGDYRNIYLNLLKIMQEKKSCALATVTSTMGSTPQFPGSSAIIGREGLIDGTVGGGKVELEVIRSARERLDSGKSGFLYFDLDKEITHTEEAICGGTMNVLVDAKPEKNREEFEKIHKSLRARKHGIFVTVTGKNDRNEFFISRKWITDATAEIFPHKVKPEVIHMLEKRKPGEFREMANDIFPGELQSVTLLESIVPAPQLIIAGAGHIGKAVSHLGKLLDFEVTVWDDRAEYANLKALPDADHILTGPLNTASEKISITPDTFIVIVTRGHKNDAEVLKEYIRSDAAFIGMIGSRNKITLVRENFIMNGWATPAEWEKIHTPIGLSIGSKSVQEIAVSIAAQLVHERHKKLHSDG